MLLFEDDEKLSFLDTSLAIKFATSLVMVVIFISMITITLQSRTVKVDRFSLLPYYICLALSIYQCFYFPLKSINPIYGNGEDNRHTTYEIWQALLQNPTYCLCFAIIVTILTYSELLRNLLVYQNKTELS